MSVTGIVAALTAEARTLGPAQPARPAAAGGAAINTLPDGTLLVISGMGAEAAAQAALLLVAAGARALLSFGLAGALDPVLTAGAVLLPQLVRDGAGTVHATDEPWREQLAARHGAKTERHRQLIEGGTLLSLAQPLTTAVTKSQARTATGAVGVDMESFAIGRIALETGVKFAVARVVIDTAADTLPPSVIRATDRHGEVAYARLLRGLVARPTDILALLRLARRYRTAMRSLRRLARPGLGLS